MKKALARKTTYFPESKVPPYAIHDENNICGFFGPYRWLSNFWKCPNGIVYEGLKYPSTEHAYQAAKVPKGTVIQIAKTNSTLDRVSFTTVSAKEVKRYGHIIPKPHNWDSIKFDIMKELLTLKFQDIDFRRMLFDTGYKHLEERNSWGDLYWGTNEQGIGQNNLGKILMTIRSRL